MCEGISEEIVLSATTCEMDTITIRYYTRNPVDLAQNPVDLRGALLCITRYHEPVEMTVELWREDIDPIIHMLTQARAGMVEK